MKKELTGLTFIYLIFILLLIAAGALSGVISEVVYYSAFIIPIIMGLVSIRASARQNGKIAIKPTRAATIGTLPLILPAVLLIFLISLGTTLLMNYFGFESSGEITEPLPLAMLLHGLIPAVLEEALFRYIPLRLLLPYSRKWAVILSALFFALIHLNLFTIPYALVAGILFALVDIRFGSILPSFILHLANNLLSLIFTQVVGVERLLPFIAVLAGGAAISIAAVFITKKSYRGLFSPLFDREDDTISYSLSPLSFIILTLFIAVSNLFIK